VIELALSRRSGQSACVPSTPAEAVEGLAATGGLVHMRWSQGELGRPGDNLYQVTFVVARPHKLLIEFDEQVLAVLTEPSLSRASDAEVVIDYEQLTVDRQGYGDMVPHSDTYISGQFTIYR
jgi:hypothetical protein